MPPDFAARLRAFAEVIVRVGLNLQPGQRLLIAEPYDLQGVARSAGVIVDAVRAVAAGLGYAAQPAIEVIWGDETRLREFARQRDWRGFSAMVAGHATLMESHVRRGDALLFLQGGQTGLLNGIPPSLVAELRRIGWMHFGPIAQQLVGGATNWTVAPAPSPDWAGVAYADLPAVDQVATLWEALFAAMRIPRPSAASGLAQPGPPGAPIPQQECILTSWQSHLAFLAQRCTDLNAGRLTGIHYLGSGTDLSVGLAPEHVWCSARLTTRFGLPFVANLPTEEVFTTPRSDSASGRVQVSRPVNFGGSVIDGIELVFRHGRVVHADARRGRELLDQLFQTDDGASRLGEVAIVNLDSLEPTPFAQDRLYYHSLLDENSLNHIALGEAYPFCLRSPSAAAPNRSLIHVDLPLKARVKAVAANPP